MRQQLLDATGGLRGQALEHVFQVSVRIVPIEPGRVHEAHDRSGALARAQAASEQPVVASNGNRPDLVLDPVVVGRQIAVIQVARQRRLAVQAVVDGLGGGRTVGHLVPL